jgi:HAD superfamily hydrolase (TIGR01484 family)
MGVVAALAAVREAGLPVLAVTGPDGMERRVVAEQTPLAAVVAENGSVALVRDGAEVRIEYVDPEPVRTANAERLRACRRAHRRERSRARRWPKTVRPGHRHRVDHAEFAHLDPARIAEVVALMRSEGMNATVSSIHVNGWFGAHSKLSGANWIVRRLLGRDLDAERDDWLYVGDSTNDELMFASFPLSVGVANIADFADRLKQWPAYVTAFDRGRGFVEVAESLLAARGA